MATMNTENAGRLLSIAEQRRQHLANIINALNVLFITLIFGIAAFFLKGFLDHSSMVNQPAGHTNNLRKVFGTLPGVNSTSAVFIIGTFYSSSY